MASEQNLRRIRPKKARKKKQPRRFAPVRWLVRTVGKLLLGAVVVVFIALAVFSVFNPPTTYYMFQESRRLGGVEQDWVPASQIAPVMMRSAVAAEDANYCLHWGVDLKALRAAIEAGGTRGASTISQQVVKNVYLWHGRSYLRKALEALITPGMEAMWSKRRILEVYLNVAEFDEGVFGIEAAANHYFGVSAKDLSAVQSARLAAVLPSPKTRSASRPTATLSRRASGILDGAATIEADGRADCFTR